MGEKYYSNYIVDINLDNIKFKTFTYNELMAFLLLNYYDINNNCVVGWEIDGFIHPLGMKYLEFSIPCKDNSYILGLVDNEAGKKTIAFCMEYNDNYETYLEDEEKTVYITFIETNYYFKRKGVLKKAFEYIKKEFIKYSSVILTSMSDEGKEINLFDRIVKVFDGSGVKVTEEDKVTLIRR